MPLLLEQGEPAHIVNTASVAGMTVAPMLGPYTVTKHAVLGLTETLYLELSSLGSPVGVSCLCPGAVATPIMDADRNRPEALGDVHELNAVERMTDDILRKGIAVGISADEVAAKVFAAIRADQFWILTHPEFADLMRERVERAVSGENPQIVSFPGVELPR